MICIISRVNLKNKTNRLLSTEIEAVFPFDKVEKGDRVIIYGAGNYGHSYIHQINKTNYCNVVLWTDTNYKSISDRVSPPLDILKTEYDKIVIAVKSNSVRENIKKYLKELGASQNKII